MMGAPQIRKIVIIHDAALTQMTAKRKRAPARLHHKEIEINVQICK